MIFATCLLPDALATPRTRHPAEQPVPEERATNMVDIDAALAKHRTTEESLKARIRDLEAKQALLQEQIRSLPLVPSLPPSPRTKFNQDNAPAWILGSIAAFACVLCIILLLRMRQPQTDEPATDKEDEHGPHALVPSSQLSLLTTASHSPDAPSSPIATFAPALPDWDPASPEFDVQAARTFAQPENIHVHDSAIELAEIMLSFGRINSAAEALSSFVENNPKEAFAPWLKLLEVYQASGQHTEFDKVARKLNKTFNVWTVNWDNFNDTRSPEHGLEKMPHILERLQQLWGTRECQAYLQNQMRDTRDESRHGFPLAVIEDIL
ncbi:MAG: hypothetical protein LBU45_05945, partial [Azoarcus sp.]|nr:hypothetical protein [Azoarcus sp.]